MTYHILALSMLARRVRQRWVEALEDHRGHRSHHHRPGFLARWPRSPGCGSGVHERAGVRLRPDRDEVPEGRRPSIVLSKIRAVKGGLADHDKRPGNALPLGREGANVILVADPADRRPHRPGFQDRLRHRSAGRDVLEAFTLRQPKVTTAPIRPGKHSIERWPRRIQLKAKVRVTGDQYRRLVAVPRGDIIAPVGRASAPVSLGRELQGVLENPDCHLQARARKRPSDAGDGVRNPFPSTSPTWSGNQRRCPSFRPTGRG